MITSTRNQLNSNFSFFVSGLNNNYLIATRDNLALIYNDKSVLENHHIAATYKFITEDPKRYNFFENFQDSDFKYCRELIIQLILATDMAFHFQEMGKMKGRLATEGNNFIQYLINQKTDFDPKKKDKQICNKIVFHAADVSNAAKPFNLASAWAERALNEFWNQGDKERELSLQISYLCDRYTVNFAKSQIGFNDVIIRPLFEVLKNFIPNLSSVIEILSSNKSKYEGMIEKYDEQLRKLNESKYSKKNSEINQ